MTDPKPYGVSLNRYERWQTREVSIGDIPLGGDQPIRIQSMTTTDTMDTAATVRQSIELFEAGCDYVRITAPSKNDAQNLELIQSELHAKGFKKPLIADIHFTPNAAELAARIVEKVRVNPGNYADRKKFETIEYSDADYRAEIERIRERFLPLVRICKTEGTAMRIGTNHGSLSDRIMSRYGDTPLGMVESALEFVRICRDEQYHQIVLSMKASNPQVMIQAYRLLISRMIAEDMDYPLHLGVTEAGDGEDGRIKSAAGIGSLLEDGIGDTIRVSLTEDPVHEVPVARALVKRSRDRGEIRPASPLELPLDPFNYARRKTNKVVQIGADKVPVVIATARNGTISSPADLLPLGYQYDLISDKWAVTDAANDFIYLKNPELVKEFPGSLNIIADVDVWERAGADFQERAYPLFNWDNFNTISLRSKRCNFLELDPASIDSLDPEILRAHDSLVIIFAYAGMNRRAVLRNACFWLMMNDLEYPVIFRMSSETDDLDAFRLECASDAGALLLDGLGDGLWLDAAQLNAADVTSTAFGILQATRMRITRTEYIACPSCGRTLFDLQKTTELIRGRTEHLKGVKIGIMGCIVNGPGEMADADYGYVGSGPGKITLYRGQEVVQKAIPTAEAVDALIELIREDGRWQEP